MPTVTFEGARLSARPGEKLRRVLNRHPRSAHNGAAKLANCRGFGTCGTCAVRIRGEVAPPTARERMRLSFPPHSPGSGLRLACQVRVEHDLVVEKLLGFWGQEIG